MPLAIGNAKPSDANLFLTLLSPFSCCYVSRSISAEDVPLAKPRVILVFAGSPTAFLVGGQ